MNIRLPIALSCFAVLCACATSDAPARETGQRDIPSATGLGFGPSEPIIRVRVSRGIEQITLAAENGMDIIGENATRHGVTQLAVSRSTSGWTITSAGEQISVGKDGFTVRPARGGVVLVGDIPLGGELHFVVNGDGDGFDVIEHIGIETYLTSVLAKELYPNWEAETYRAQAIAARSYALHERARQRGLGSAHDVESSVQDQAYGGASTHQRARLAVLRTRGVVMQHANDVVRAYYSSTCGGRSASARDVWPISVGFRFNLSAPLQTSPRQNACSGSPRFRWQAQRDRDVLSARLRAFAAANGLPFSKMKRISRVKVEKRNAHKRPNMYTLTDSAGGRWSVKPEDLRNACNYSDGNGLAKVAKEQFVYSGDLLFVIHGGGQRGGVTIKGRGFGHGVGMCQFGAQGLAKKGWTTHRILRHYYPGAEIVTAYK